MTTPPVLRTRPRALPARAVVDEKLVRSDAAWAATLRRFGRYAVWALPAYGLAQFVSGVFDPSRLDGAIAVAVAAWLGPVGMVALTALLAGMRGRGVPKIALVALLLGLAAGGLWYASTGESAYRDRLALAGGAALTLAWVLYGVAVIATRVLPRADGALLLIAAPLLGLGGTYHHRLPAIGALLLLAGGLGLARTASRLLPGHNRGRAARRSTADRRSGRPADRGLPRAD
jgi:hypothetical protein